MLLICEGPYSRQAADSALEFAKATLAQGHVINQIFFYYDGVYLASAYARPEQSERKVAGNWVEFAAANQLDLVVCSNSAMKRGILDESQAQQTGRDGYNLHPGFKMAGLGQFVEALTDCDRLISFGA